MSEQWPLKTLGELCERVCVGFVGSTSKHYRDDGVLFLRTKNVGRTGEVNLDDVKYITRDFHDSTKKSQLKSGDVILSRVVTDRINCSYIPENFPDANCANVVIVRPGSDVDSRFLVYYIKSKASQDYLLSKRKGSAQLVVNTTIVKEWPVRIPPLEEQQRIVSTLDDVFTQISITQQSTTNILESAEELFRSNLHESFTNMQPGWVESTISELATHSLGKMLDKNKNTGSFKPYLRNKNVRWFDFDLSDINEMKFEDNESSKYTALLGDLLICEGGYPGRAAIWNGAEPVYFQKALHRVRFHEGNHTKWFLYYLYYLDLTGGLRRHFTGTGIQHFTGKSLAKMSIPIAPPDEIDSITMILEQLHSGIKYLSKLSDEKMVQLTELKQSILQEAFSGQI